MSHEVIRVSWSRAAHWYGSLKNISALIPFKYEENPKEYILGGLKKGKNPEKCVIYCHGFPDQACDHRKECPELYGQYSDRMSKKLSEAYDTFCSFTMSGTPGSESGLAFQDKSVSQEVWDVLNVMSYLKNVKQVGTAGFHIVGLSTGAIIGSVLRGVTPEIMEKLNLSPILTIAIIAGCGTDINRALEFDFDEAQRADFNEKGYCMKGFWLPVGSVSNPKEAILPSAPEGESAGGGESAGENSEGSKKNDFYEGSKEAEQSKEADPSNCEIVRTPPALVKWLEHEMKLLVSYREDFLQLPIKEHVESGTIPFLVIHGCEDKDVDIEEGKKVFAAAAQPKRYFEIAKGNHMLTNSKDLKKAINEMKAWQQQWESA